MAWSHLEARSEITLWGILEADERLGPIVTDRLDLRGRWDLILVHARKKHNSDDIERLRAINKDLVTVTRDRNIIVHGLVHARMITNKPLQSGDKIPGGTELQHLFVRPPCWTIFRGADAGKNFLISTAAVTIVRENIHTIEKRVTQFNKDHHYAARRPLGDILEAGWPAQLE